MTNTLGVQCQYCPVSCAKLLCHALSTYPLEAYQRYLLAQLPPKNVFPKLYLIQFCFVLQHLTELQAKLHYLKIICDLRSFGGRFFTGTMVVRTSFLTHFRKTNCEEKPKHYFERMCICYLSIHITAL